MFTTVTCPTCGYKQNLHENRMRQKVKCPNCDTPFVAGASTPGIPPPESDSSSTPLTPPVRRVSDQQEEVIRYSCPQCRKTLESPCSMAGQKLNCPGCGQRLRIPPPINKTMLGLDETPPRQAPPPVVAVPPVPHIVVKPLDPPPRQPDSRPVSPRESCLECGRDLTNRKRLLSCPDCDALLCSAGCLRDHENHTHRLPLRVDRVRRGFRCPYCGCTEPPLQSSDISAAGWVVFALMLLFCFPLFWIGLLIKEEYRRCVDCGARLP
jgi:lipopolysaccharide-induced tumor necrosis factor-alpha factor